MYSLISTCFFAKTFIMCNGGLNLYMVFFMQQIMFPFFYQRQLSPIIDDVMHHHCQHMHTQAKHH